MDDKTLLIATLALALAACGDTDPSDTGPADPGESDTGGTDGGDGGGDGGSDGGGSDGGGSDGGGSDGGGSDGGGSDGGGSDGGDGGTDTDGGDDTGDTGGTAACPDFFPADQVGIQWSFRTEHDNGDVVRWTQEVLPQESGRFVLRTLIEGTTSDLHYTCDGDGAVELHGGNSVGSAFSTDYAYSPAMLVWPGGEAATKATWYSAGSQTGTWSAGGTSGALSGSYTSTWTVTGVDLTYELDDGTTLTDCFTYTRAATTAVMGTTVSTDELGIYCGALYGLVWSDVVTTTDTGAGPPQVAESWTTLTGLTPP